MQIFPMPEIQVFTFNIYQENTYLIWDEDRNAVIIDPGCYTPGEREALKDFITQHELRLVKLLNTHGHIDHMLGNRWVADHYKIPFVTHQLVVQELASVQAYAGMMGLNPDISPDPDEFVDDGDVVTAGSLEFEVLFTPGHSPGHISFFHRPSNSLFSGDVLFERSIGRVDLPGGSYPVLMESIFQKLLPLGDEVKVFPGHGYGTTLGQERVSNPFILEYQKSV